MLIGNVYLDIKVKDAQNREQYLTYDNMQELILVETAGTSLPYICFSFWSLNKDLIELFIENNEVEVSIGNSVQDANTFKMNLLSTPKNNDASDSTATIAVNGFLGDKSYMVDRGKCKAYIGNSLMVAQQILKNYNNLNNIIDTDIDRVNENQVTWRQLYETSAAFMVRTLLHMNIQPSFPLFSFDKFGNFHIKDFQKAIKNEPVARFTPVPTKKGDIQYINNFNLESYKATYNLYSGYNKVTEIYGAETGMPGYVLAENTPILASTKESEKADPGNRISLNRIQSANVHNTYMDAYNYNTNKLVALSSMQGVLLINGYYPHLKPTDIVYVETPKENGQVSSLEGLYIIDTIMLSPNFRNGTVLTYVYVTRDNNNNIENFITPRPQGLKIKSKQMKDVLNAVSKARSALALCSQIMDGTFVSTMQSFLTASKTNLLRMFSVRGVTIDLNSQARMLQSFLCVGNTLMNAFVNMVFPEAIAYELKDILINKPTARGIVGDYIYDYVPVELQNIVSSLVDSIFTVNDSLNSIAGNNGITAREILEVTATMATVVNSDEVEESRVDNIIQDFENNTTGLDIPFPLINLTESQKLMADSDLRNYLATETTDNLVDLGYMDNLSEEELLEFKDILLGKTPINYSIISKINASAGNTLNYRFWGTYGATNEPLYAWGYKGALVYTKTLDLNRYTRFYNSDYTPYQGNDFTIIKNNSDKYEIYYVVSDGVFNKATRSLAYDVTTDALSQLTSYYIGKGYKDRYRTLPCTKLINASKNARLYFACPTSEDEVKFYINSKRVELDSFPIYLGYTDVYGNPILYNVYFTTTGYNSNSTLLEVRQG